MPSNGEKQRRKTIVRALAAQERAEEEAAMPLSKADLRALLKTLEDTLFERRDDGATWCYCDHTLERTLAFLRMHQLPEAEVIDWLGDYGGFCDCEVAANVGDAWAKRIATT